jgi:hypothetical protein
MVPLVQRPAPSFKANAVVDGLFKEVSLETFTGQGKWCVLPFQLIIKHISFSFHFSFLLLYCICFLYSRSFPVINLFDSSRLSRSLSLFDLASVLAYLSIETNTIQFESCRVVLLFYPLYVSTFWRCDYYIRVAPIRPVINASHVSMLAIYSVCYSPYTCASFHLTQRVLITINMLITSQRLHIRLPNGNPGVQWRPSPICGVKHSCVGYVPSFLFFVL